MLKIKSSMNQTNKASRKYGQKAQGKELISGMAGKDEELYIQTSREAGGDHNSNVKEI